MPAVMMTSQAVYTGFTLQQTGLIAHQRNDCLQEREYSVDILLIVGVISAVLMIGIGLYYLLRSGQPKVDTQGQAVPDQPAIADDPADHTLPAGADQTAIPAQTVSSNATAINSSPSPAEPVRLSEDSKVIQADENATTVIRPAAHEQAAHEVDEPSTEIIRPATGSAPVTEASQSAPLSAPAPEDLPDLLDHHLDDHERQDEASVLANAEQIIMLQLLPKQNRVFNGDTVLELFRSYGLCFGGMSLFHRYQESDGSGQLMFSVLRATDEGPQQFDLETLSEDDIDGLWFFLALPGPAPVAGFDTLISIGQRMASDLDAQLCDENGEPFTPQKRSEYRDMVVSFIRQQQVQ